MRGRRAARAALIVLLAGLGGLTAAGSAEAQVSGAAPGPRLEAAQLRVRDWFGRPSGPPRARRWQQKKSPRLAMISSILVPGLGQLYNERELWALVAAGVHFYFIGDIIVQARLANRYRELKNADPEDTTAQVLFLLHRDNRVQSTWLLGLTMLLSGLQSFVDAHLFDFEERVPLQLGPSFGNLTGGALRWRF